MHVWYCLAQGRKQVLYIWSYVQYMSDNITGNL